MAYGGLNQYSSIDAAAELGRNPVSKHQIQPEYGDEQADAGRDYEPAPRDKILRRERGQVNVNFPCSADHEQDWQPYPVDPYPCMYVWSSHTYILHTYIDYYYSGPQVYTTCGLVGTDTEEEGEKSHSTEGSTRKMQDVIYARQLQYALSLPRQRRGGVNS